jgi:hypothetical protein
MPRHRTVTPVRVSHEFLLHVFFAVDGQNDQGQPLPSPFDPGEIRAMTVSIPTEIPSVRVVCGVLRRESCG